jgi:hypothetical protein
MVMKKVVAHVSTQDEDVYWQETDKVARKKIARAQAKETKADAKLQAKSTRRALEAEEEKANAVAAAAKVPQKITQFEIARRQALAAAIVRSPDRGVVPQPRLMENMNRASGVVVASGLDAALGALDDCGVGAKCRREVSFDELSTCSTRCSTPPRRRRR